MTSSNVVPFPGKVRNQEDREACGQDDRLGGLQGQRPKDFTTWLNWVRCELSILGYDMDRVDHDWRTDFLHGRKPEEAAIRAISSYA